MVLVHVEFIPIIRMGSSYYSLPHAHESSKESTFKMLFYMVASLTNVQSHSMHTHVGVTSLNFSFIQED